MAAYLVGADGKMRITGAGCAGAGREMRFAAQGSMISSQDAAKIADFSQRRLVFNAILITHSF
jgi:hypothetical protein